MVTLQLSNTQIGDLDYVIAAECHAENRSYIIPWSREKHLQAISDPDIAHLIVRDQSNVGFVILAGLLNPNQSLEFRRIVITDKGKGYGKATVEQVKASAFDTYQAHRLWLDVKVQNYRAQAIYQQAGLWLKEHYVNA